MKQKILTELVLSVCPYTVTERTVGINDSYLMGQTEEKVMKVH